MSGRRVTDPEVGRMVADLQFHLGGVALTPAERLRVAAAKSLPVCVVCGAETKTGPGVCADCLAEEDVQ